MGPRPPSVPNFPSAISFDPVARLSSYHRICGEGSACYLLHLSRPDCRIGLFVLCQTTCFLHLRETVAEIGASEPNDAAVGLLCSVRAVSLPSLVTFAQLLPVVGSTSEKFIFPTSRNEVDRSASNCSRVCIHMRNEYFGSGVSWRLSAMEKS